MMKLDKYLTAKTALEYVGYGQTHYRCNCIMLRLKAGCDSTLINTHNILKCNTVSLSSTCTPL